MERTRAGGERDDRGGFKVGYDDGKRDAVVEKLALEGARGSGQCELDVQGN
jgi:hypothetical protein